MSTPPSTPSQTSPAKAWEEEIRACEEAARAAFLQADLPVLQAMWAEGYAVNSPLQRVLTKPQVLEALRTGRIRHTAYEFEIEHLSRHGEVVVVMGRDRVEDPPAGTISHRRFTNVWQRIDGEWQGVARHAHVVSREAAV